MPILYLSYLNLTPGLTNQFSDESHQVVIRLLRKEFSSWSGFFSKYPDFDLGFIVVTKKNNQDLIVRGPAVSKKEKLIDYSIFLPEVLPDLSQYLDLIFEGFSKVVSNFGVDRNNIMRLKSQCKSELRL